MPGVTPTAVKAAHAVGVGACQKYLCALFEGQGAVVLEQYHALLGCVQGNISMPGTCKLRVCLGICIRCAEQSQTEFHAQDAAYGIIDAAHGYRTLLNEFLQDIAELQAVGVHGHVNAGVDGHLDGFFLILGNLVAVVKVVYIGPVGKDHSVPS